MYHSVYTRSFLFHCRQSLHSLSYKLSVYKYTWFLLCLSHFVSWVSAAFFALLLPLSGSCAYSLVQRYECKKIEFSGVLCDETKHFTLCAVFLEHGTMLWRYIVRRQPIVSHLLLLFRCFVTTSFGSFISFLVCTLDECWRTNIYAQRIFK